MRATLIASLALTACAAAPLDAQAPVMPPNYGSVDHAGHRMEPLIVREGEACTRDEAWCVTTDGDVVRVGLAHRWPMGGEGFTNDENKGVWPFIVRNADDTEALAGVLTTEEDSYSGGGASATTLTLYRISLHDGATEDAAPPSVLSAQASGDAMIRACFSEDDQRARRDACHDRYAFAAMLALDETVNDGPPRLVLTTQAWTFPGRRSRTEDSTQAPPLSAHDLVWTRDATCSYQRTFAYSQSTGAYAPDQPLPACEDYKTQ